MNSIKRIIYQRHSTRSFDPLQSLSKTSIETIIAAGCQAPSPKNRQPWSFIVLTRKADLYLASDILLTELGNLKKERINKQKDFEDLNMAIVSARIIRDCSALVFINYERDERNEHGDALDWTLSAQAFEVTDIQAIGACIENMALFAESQGIASLWLGDVLYAEQELYVAFKMKSPFIAAIAFGIESPSGSRYSIRDELDNKVTWFCSEG